MRKIDITDEQLRQIVALREKGHSWIYIERVTGIPRRAAQHRFKEFQKSRLAIEVSEARKEFSKEEFGRHVDALTNLAAALQFAMALPEWPEIETSAKDKLDGLLGIEIPPVNPVHPTILDATKITARRRRNQRLLDALKQHTAKEAPWERIEEEWAVAWDACRKLLPQFVEEADKVFRALLEEAPGQKEQIKEYAARKDGVGDIAKWIPRCPWRLMTVGDEDWGEAFSIREGVGTKKDLFELRCGSDQVTTFSNKASAETALKICRQAMKRIKALPVAKDLKAEVAKVQSVVEEFQDRFDAVELRPVILRTRCALCPA
jgi:hypothetical protein